MLCSRRPYGRKYVGNLDQALNLPIVLRRGVVFVIEVLPTSGSQDARKFQRLIKFAQALPVMRTTIAKHLRQPDLGRERVLACVLRILSTCFLRSGSEVYASENGSYGLATLRRKHVKVRGDVVEFDFPG